MKRGRGRTRFFPAPPRGEGGTIHTPQYPQTQEYKLEFFMRISCPVLAHK